MPADLRVKPVEGRSLPREDNPRRRITEECSVPSTRYYRQAIRKGDIELVQPSARATVAAKKEG